MVSTVNGSGPDVAPAWRDEVPDLTARWQARVRERQERVLTDQTPVKVELPSGDFVFAIQGNILSLFEAGRIPDALTSYVIDLLNVPSDTPHEEKRAMFLDRFVEWHQLMDATWLVCVVEPKFSREIPTPEGMFPLRAVDIEDKIALYNWCNGVADHLAAFRGPADAARERPDESSVQPAPGDLVRRRSKRGSAEGETDSAGDVLRGEDRRKPVEGDANGMGTVATGARGNESETGSGLDIATSGRARPRSRRGGGED